MREREGERERERERKREKERVRERERERGLQWHGGNNVISQRKAAGKRRDTTAWS